MTTHRHQDSRKLWTTTVTDPDLSPYAKQADLTTLADRMTALETRVSDLEAVQPPPPVTPPTDYAGTLTLTPADSNATFTDYHFTGADLTGSAIKIMGTSTAPVRNITLVRPHFTNWRQAVESYYCLGLSMIDPVFGHQGYAGVLFNSGGGLSIHNPTADTVFRPAPYPTSGGEQNNAYFLKLDVSSPSDPVPDTCEVVGGNLVGASTMWQGLNAHAGRHVKFVGVTISKVPRAIFVALIPGATLFDFTITDNILLDAQTVPGGTDEKTAIAYGSIDTVLIDRNQISRTFDTPIADRSIYTNAGPSANVTLGVNPLVA